MIINFVLNTDYIAYALLGIGIGYVVTYGIIGDRTTKVERMRHDVEVKKEFFRIKAELNRKK